MVKSRRRFLSTGKYDVISDEVARLVREFAPEGEETVIIDSGCGEGYHTCRIAEAVGGRVICAAFDASKSAADLGAKLAKSKGFLPREGIGAEFDGDVSVSFMTGNIFSLPIKAGTASAVVSMFAPIAWEENARMLEADGIVVVAASGEDHLIEMREVIYDEVRKKSPETPTHPANFELAAARNVKERITLEDGGMISDLFGMTPFYYRADAAGRERLFKAESLDVTVDVMLYVFRKLPEE